ncbi:hypothetical protein [Streptacidiphilus cavernicola]|uniref:Uncharacterized protein n=1 Tax=Streptacidiphilus cavernicola TaxID=3342716 RepID=A0ABV6VSF4_9ACTN
MSTAPRDLLRAARSADPRHLPEQLAVQAVRLLGPHATAAAARVRAAHPDAVPGRWSRTVAERGIRATVAEGAFLGGPFMLLWPAAFGAALVAQLTMVLELAALPDRPRSPEELAEDLLVLQGVSPTPAAARALLDAASHADRGEPAGPRPGWWSTGRRLAYLIGLLTPADPAGSRGRNRSRAGIRLRRAATWAGVAAVVLVGCAAPLVWIPASAEMYRRATAGLAARATAYYSPVGGYDPLPAGGRRWLLRPGAVLVAVRALVSVLLTAAVLAAVLLADLRIASSHWPAAVLLLIAVSALYAALLRRHRRH